MGIERMRLDELVVELGLAPSRNVARGLIMAGAVLVSGKVVDKAGTAIAVDAELTLKSRPRFVSRAGDKLAGALESFGVAVQGRLALDVGASTGGFVDCLLQAGAAQVIALDVGRGQLDSRLRDDARVVVMDGLNARLLQKGDLAYEPDLVTMDVSFISVGKVLGAVANSMAVEFEGVILIKPQFEAGPKSVGKKGIVRDPMVHRQVLVDAARFSAEELGLDLHGVCRSSVPGVGGNVEFFLHVSRGREKGLGLDRLEKLIDDCVHSGVSPQGGE
jgi:23S rRNA (cytidine1920-2'-O)/16S rRNA (cytidine1409-2'-O)-methyltransferase